MNENLDTNETTVVEDTDIIEAKRKIKKFAIKTATQLTLAFAAGVAVAAIVGKLAEKPVED